MSKIPSLPKENSNNKWATNNNLRTETKALTQRDNSPNLFANLETGPTTKREASPKPAMFTSPVSNFSTGRNMDDVGNIVRKVIQLEKARHENQVGTEPLRERCLEYERRIKALCEKNEELDTILKEREEELIEADRRREELARAAQEVVSMMENMKNENTRLIETCRNHETTIGDLEQRVERLVLEERVKAEFVRQTELAQRTCEDMYIKKLLEFDDAAKELEAVHQQEFHRIMAEISALKEQNRLLEIKLQNQLLEREEEQSTLETEREIWRTQEAELRRRLKIMEEKGAKDKTETKRPSQTREIPTLKVPTNQAMTAVLSHEEANLLAQERQEHERKEKEWKLKEEALKEKLFEFENDLINKSMSIAKLREELDKKQHQQPKQKQEDQSPKHVSEDHSTALKRVAELEQELVRMSLEMNLKETQLKEVTEHKNQLENGIKAMQEAIIKKEETTYERIKAMEAKLRNEEELAQLAEARSNDDVTVLIAEVDKLRQEQKIHEEIVSSLTKERDEYLSQVKEAESEHEAEIEKLETKYQKLIERYQNTIQTLKQGKDAGTTPANQPGGVDEAEANLLREKIKELEDSNAEMTKKVAMLEDKVKRRAEIGNMDNDEALERIEELETEIEQHEEELAKAQMAKLEMANKLIAVQNELDDLQIKYQDALDPKAAKKRQKEEKEKGDKKAKDQELLSQLHPSLRQNAPPPAGKRADGGRHTLFTLFSAGGS